MLKKLFIALLIWLIPTTGFCLWKFNPHTGKLDYYETGGAVSDDVYGAGWDGVTTVAPSKNAVYDKIQTISAGSGDITSVGDVADGAAFDGTQGTTLTFNNVGGDATIVYNGTTFTFNKFITSDVTGALTGIASGNALPALSNLSSVAINTSLISDTAATDDLGTEAIYWRKLYLGSDISFEGATDDAYQTTLTAVDTTLSDKSINIPNASGTMAVSATAPVTLSALGDVGITVAKDIVAGVGLSGGENDVLPGADADTTLTLDLTEVNSATFGSGTFTTLIFDAGATDPTWTYGSNSIAVTNAATFTLPTALIVNPADPADAGAIRLNNAENIAWEAAPAGTDMTLGVDASEILQYSGTINATALTEGGNAVYNSTEVPGGELGGTWASPTIDDSVAVTSWALTTPTVTTSIAINADPADTGAIRLSNADYIYSEAAPAGTDISVLGVDATEIVQIAASGASGVTITPTTTITGDLTVNGDDIQLGATGVKITDDTDGAITFLGTSAGADENLRINLDDTANVIVMDSTTAATELDWLGTSGSAASFGLGLTGVLISDDNDGAITFLGRSTGSDEDMTFNLDDTANTVTVSSSTGVTSMSWSGIGLATTAAGDSYFNEQVAIGQTSAAYLLDILGADNTTIARIKNNATQANTTTTDIFLSFDSTTGVEGTIAGTAVAGVVAYNTFLGSHWTKIEDEIPQVGQVLEMTGEVTDKGSGGFAYLAKSRICKTAGSGKIYGVYGGTDKEGHDLVFAVGAGVVLVSGKVKAGDLLEADGKGYARKQWHPFVTSSTLGKATQDYDGKEGIKLIGCVFYSG